MLEVYSLSWWQKYSAMCRKYNATGCPEQRVAAATVRKRILLNLPSLQTDHAISASRWQAGKLGSEVG